MKPKKKVGRPKKKEILSIKEVKKLPPGERAKYYLENYDDIGDNWDPLERLAFHYTLMESLIYPTDAEQEIVDAMSGSFLGEGYPRRDTYETNHNFILRSMAEGFQRGIFKSISDIAKETKLSRTTVYKHVKDFETVPFRELQEAKIRMTRDYILAILAFEASRNHDTQAAGLFLKYTQPIEEKAQRINNQTNYIQINNLRVSEEEIKALPPNKLKAIEDILQASLSKQLETKGLQN